MSNVPAELRVSKMLSGLCAAVTAEVVPRLCEHPHECQHPGFYILHTSKDASFGKIKRVSDFSCALIALVLVKVHRFWLVVNSP